MQWLCRCRVVFSVRERHGHDDPVFICLRGHDVQALRWCLYLFLQRVQCGQHGRCAVRRERACVCRGMVVDVLVLRLCREAGSGRPVVHNVRASCVVLYTTILYTLGQVLHPAWTSSMRCECDKHPLASKQWEATAGHKQQIPRLRL